MFFPEIIHDYKKVHLLSSDLITLFTIFRVIKTKLKGRRKLELGQKIP